MSDSEAREIIAKAEKKSQPTGGLLKWFSRDDSSRLEEAAELFVEAANIYRLSKQLEVAGDTFLRAAKCHLDASNDHEAGSMFVEAYKCYKSSNPSRACESLEKAIDIFTRKGQLRRGAYFKYELAEIQELDLNDCSGATKNFETAGDWYLQDQAVALANKSYLKCADLLALDKKYLQAAEIYTKVVYNSLGNRLSQWALKEYYLKLALCYLAATDIVASEKTVNEALRQDPSFENSREHTLVSDLIEDVKQGDLDAFTSHVTDFDRFTKLDRWKTTLLLQIKETISGADDDLL